MDRKNQNFRFGTEPFDLLRRCQPSHPRHADVHNYQVWMQCSRLRDRFFPIRCLANNMKSRISLKDRAHGLSHRSIVVRYECANLGHTNDLSSFWVSGNQVKTPDIAAGKRTSPSTASHGWLRRGQGSKTKEKLKRLRFHLRGRGGASPWMAKPLMCKRRFVPRPRVSFLPCTTTEK